MFSDLAVIFGSLTLTLFTGGLLLTRSWIGAVQRDRLRQQDRPASAVQVETRFSSPDPAPPPAGWARLDVRQAADAALRRLDGTAAKHGVRLEVAIEAGLQVQMSPVGLEQVLDATLGHAIVQAPGGKVMIGAMRHGGRIQLAILGDGAGPDRQTRESRLRDTIAIVALQGGTVEVISHFGGNSVVMRLPEPPQTMVSRPEDTMSDAAGAVRPQPNAAVRESIAFPAL